MFYDILRGWKHFLDHGVKPGGGVSAGGKFSGGGGKRGLNRSLNGGKSQRPTFALEEHFGPEINALITLQMNPVNMAHFAELFQVRSKLIFLCVKGIFSVGKRISLDTLCFRPSL